MTINYVCKRCGYHTHIRTKYFQHLNNKRVCKPILSEIDIDTLIDELNYYIKNNIKTGIQVSNVIKDSRFFFKTEQHATGDDEVKKMHVCLHCGRLFSKNCHLHRHIRDVCKEQKNSILENTVVEQQQTIAKLQEENKTLAKQNQTTNNTKNINSHNNITNNITLQTYGNEDFGYIAQDLLRSFQTNPYESIPRLVGLIHFNAEHPENHNVKWVNVNKNWLQVYQKKEGWVSRDKKDVIRDLNDQAYFAVDIEYDPTSTTLSDTQKRYYEKFRDEYDNGMEETIKRLEKQTERMIIDKRVKR